MSILNLDTRLVLDQSLTDSPNLCDRLTEKDLTLIGLAVWSGYQRDLGSRSKWERRMEAALDLALQVQKDKSFPWQGAANVVFPLVTIAALQFSARAYPAIVQGTDVVRYRIVGSDKEGELRKRADRISKHMSWQVLEQDTSWEAEHDKELINLAIVGCNFIKTYFSPSQGHNVSELVMAKDFVIDYWAKSVEGAARKTHVFPLYRNEVYERVMSGTFAQCLNDDWYTTIQPSTSMSASVDNRQGVSPPAPDEDTPLKFLEQHRLLDLDGDGYAEPYIVTVHEASHKVVRIVARWDDYESDVIRTPSGKISSIRPTEYFTKYSFIPSPDGGIYDLGFGVFLGPINEAVNTGINQILDNGTINNSSGGFLGRGAKIRGGVYTMAPWEWKRVDSTGDDLRKNLIPFPDRQPSPIMFQLLGLMIQYADRISGTVESMTGENPGQNTTAETTRTTTEQGMQVYSMIFKRVWRSMKEEFKKLYALNRRFAKSEEFFGSKDDFIRREDYTGSTDHIAPVANPNITSSVMRMSQATMVKQSSMATAGYDHDEVELAFLKAAGVEDIERLYPGVKVTGPLPNFKLQIQELKSKEAGLKLQQQHLQWAHETMLDARKVQAEIELIKAQAAEVLASIGADKAAMQLQAFDSLISAMEKQQKLLNDRVKMAIDFAGDKDGEGKGKAPGGAGVSGLAGPSGNQGIPQNAGGIPGGSEGPMGAGADAGGGPA